MKRRTRLICIGCAIAGTVPIAAQAASASTNSVSINSVSTNSVSTNSVSTNSASTNEAQSSAVYESTAAPRLIAAVRPATAAPAVPATIGRVTVAPGDTLSAIGARTSRTWEQLASYNHIPDPNLIYPDQIITIPPAGFMPVATATPTRAVESSSEDPATPTAAPVHQAASTSAPQTSTASASGVWGCIASHESGSNPATNTGNGYYGMYQDTQSSWVAGGGLAYAPRADLASPAAQTTVNQRIQAQQGWGAWPASSAACGV
jgi:LysM repeat protein